MRRRTRASAKAAAASRDALRSSLLRSLTPEGVAALEGKEIGALVNEEARETYRNPPAHTRFVSLARAQACRRYVDDALQRFARWFRAD